MELAILVPRGIDVFPAKKERMSGTIDVWWIVRILDQRRFDNYNNFALIIFNAVSASCTSQKWSNLMGCFSGKSAAYDICLTYDIDVSLYVLTT